jgi:hypothetical protein
MLMRRHSELIVTFFARTAPHAAAAEHVQIVLAGGLMGATHAVAVIESTHWWLGVFAAVVLGAGAVCTAYRCRCEQASHIQPLCMRRHVSY